MIFDSMVGKNQGGETGFGIGGRKHPDNRILVIVGCEKRMVTTKGVSPSLKTSSSALSFEQIVKNEAKNKKGN